MSWAASPSPYWSFFKSPFGFYPPFIAASSFETPRITMPTGSELNDEVDFYGVFSNDRNQSPLRIRRDITEECWKKACLHSNFCVLLVKKAYGERERTGYIWLHRWSLLWQEGTIFKVSYSSERGRSISAATTARTEEGRLVEDIQRCSSCHSITCGQRTRPYLF